MLPSVIQTGLRFFSVNELSEYSNGLNNYYKVNNIDNNALIYNHYYFPFRIIIEINTKQTLPRWTPEVYSSRSCIADRQPVKICTYIAYRQPDRHVTRSLYRGCVVVRSRLNDDLSGRLQLRRLMHGKERPPSKVFDY